MSLLLKLKELRETIGISQSAFAREINVAQNTVSNWERGTREPDNETLAKIADFFGVTTDYLLGREPNEDKKNSLPPLNQKDEKDISVALDKILNNLECEEALSFYGEPMDEHTKELIKLSLENSMKMAKQMAKKKFTPKKYR